LFEEEEEEGPVISEEVISNEIGNEIGILRGSLERDLHSEIFLVMESNAIANNHYLYP